MMFERVLIPTDFSKYSLKVIECIKELPGVKDVVLLHVIGPMNPLARVWDPGGRVEEAKIKLEKQKQSLESFGLNVKARVEIRMEGTVSMAIQSIADEEKIPLIVMGARGRGRVEGIFLGNVAKDILRYGNTDLLLMRYMVLEGGKPGLHKFWSQPFSKVLCPTDLSESASETISFISGLETVEEIVLVHVVSMGETWKEIEGEVVRATRSLQDIGKEIEQTGKKSKIYVSVGSPAEEISNVASAENVSLIAMNAHGKTWIEQWTVGSTTYDVARIADRPVLVRRPEQINRIKYPLIEASSYSRASL